MARTLSFVGATGANYYFKPDPFVTPWGNDVIDAAPGLANVYSAEVGDGAYFVFRRAGSQPAATDTIVAQFGAPSGAIVNILPNVVRQAELQQGSKIKAWVRQGSPIFGSVYDSANNPVDLSAFTGIKFTATTANGVELLVIESDDIEITGTDNNTFHFDPPVELVERARVLQWSIRDEADDELISSGTLEIVFAP